MPTLYTVQAQAEHLNINVLSVIKKIKLIYWFKKDFKFKLSTTCRAGLGGACKGNRTSSAENRHNTHLNDGEACCYLNLQDCTTLYQMWGTGHFREFPTGMSCSGGGRGRRRGQGGGGRVAWQVEVGLNPSGLAAARPRDKVTCRIWTFVKCCWDINIFLFFYSFMVVC